MMVQSLKNQYRGINAHLHSYWQAEGEWDLFHKHHITHLVTALSGALRPMGYRVKAEQALQIRRESDLPRRPESDLTIYDPLLPRQGKPTLLNPASTAPALTLSIADLYALKVPDLDPYYAIAIYQLRPNQAHYGQPVAWLELLSPSNKIGGQDANDYREKILKLLQSGIVLVELDYLHETPPTFSGIPAYKRWDANTHTYRISVIDPRPRFQDGSAMIYQFDVDDPLPEAIIPLNAGDYLSFDFGLAYEKTFEEIFYGDEVDYSQLPLHFDRYSPADQHRILTRLITVLTAARNGQDLEQAPLPLEQRPSDLESALKEFERLTANGNTH